MTSRSRVVVEADGASRGNPGPAAYGVVLKDADTGEVIAEEADTLGTATNNVAEYRGLVAGLRLAARYAPGARLEVRLDSKLVVEQMAGNWKVKKDDLKPLQAEAARLAPVGTAYTWVPRERNAHADRLANEALDGAPIPARPSEIPGQASRSETPDQTRRVGSASDRTETHGQVPTLGETTTLVLVRHGVTAQTTAKRFSGGLAGTNPPLTGEGRAQIRSTADWLSALGHEATAVVASPVRRTRESAEIIAERLGLPLVEERGFAEMEFGEWDGLTFGEVATQHKDTFKAWLGDTSMPAPGGESFEEVRDRVLAGLDRVLSAYAGQTVIVVSHVTPIKTLVSHALDSPLDSGFRMELSPASVSVLTYFTDPAGVRRGAMRLFNATPPG